MKGVGGVDLGQGQAADGNQDGETPQVEVVAERGAKATKRAAKAREGEEAVEGDVDAQASVLPRMMMLLAGAVAVGKMLDRGGAV